MAYSLEARAPFLDRQLVQLCFSVPRLWHRRGGIGKRMLRETFRGLLPPAVWRRRKQGFAVPIHRWFRDQILDRELEQLLAETPSPLFAPFVQELLQTHRSTNRDQGYRLWQIYVYLLWRNRSFARAS
jgi:asparagine synthase (glutamine-hydrolysing)